MSDELLTPAQVAAITQYPVKTLYDLFAPKGDLPVVRATPHSRIRIRRSDLDAWIARHLQAAKSTPEEPPRAAAARETVVNLPGVNRYVN